jgi:hypothetical protein
MSFLQFHAVKMWFQGWDKNIEGRAEKKRYTKKEVFDENFELTLKWWSLGQNGIHNIERGAGKQWG